MNKAILKDTSKQLLRKALLPNLILVPFLIFLHWCIISIWFYFNHETESFFSNLSMGLIVGSISATSIFLWGMRRLIIRAYLIIHNNIISILLRPFCRMLAQDIVSKDINPQDSIIFNEWIEYLNEKLQEYPRIIQKIVRLTVRKMGYTDELETQIKLVLNGDLDEISNLINERIGIKLVEASNLIIPAFVTYFIPINMILIIALWLI